MITEIVTFKLPVGISREEVVARFRASAPRWRDNPDLIRKNYLYDAATGTGGGVYLWRDRASAERWHGAEFRRKIAETYGAEPEFRYFETPIVVDAAAYAIAEAAE